MLHGHLHVSQIWSGQRTLYYVQHPAHTKLIS